MARGDETDPFAAFLSWRPSASPTAGSRKRLPVGEGSGEPPVLAYSDKAADLSDDPFATFQSLRPPEVPTEAPAEQRLKEEVLRAKRQLLEVAIEVELQEVDPSRTDRLRQVRKAKKYLKNPERAFTVFSDSESETGNEETSRAEEGGASGSKAIFSFEDTSEATENMESTCKPLPKDATYLSSSPSQTVPRSAGGTLSLTQSAPDLLSSGSALQSQLQPISSLNVLEAASPSTTLARTGGLIATSTLPYGVHSPKAERLLTRWSSELKQWNVSVSRSGLIARRHHVQLGGGAIVMGDGKMPLYRNRDMLVKGYFYAFRIESIDDTHHPRASVKDHHLVFGVSRLPAIDKACTKKMFAYQIPGVHLNGYGSKMIKDTKWVEGGFATDALEVGDIVGVMICRDDADLVIFVNGEQVLRTPTSLIEEVKGKTLLYPVLDLPGRVSAVTLLPSYGPPVVPRQRRT